MSRDSAYIELEDIRMQMSGISPKTETWQKLNVRAQELEKRTGGNKVEHPMLMPKQKMYQAGFTPHPKKWKKAKQSK